VHQIAGQNYLLINVIKSHTGERTFRKTLKN